MARTILVCGAAGNQGGAIAKLLLKYPEQYTTRALTRSANSARAKELKALGAEIVVGDLNIYADVQAVMEGCWGVFGVTNFYDSVCFTLLCFILLRGEWWDIREIADEKRRK
jgi:uncharacterized protein YbjT (DUF2867 family)